MLRLNNRSGLVFTLLIMVVMWTVLIAFAQLQGPLTSASISNGVACIEINNPPAYKAGVTLRWTKFMVASKGGDPCINPNLFLGDLTAGLHLGGLYYSPYTDTGDELNPQIFVAKNSTIVGIINSKGIRERIEYSLVGNLPVVLINFTLSGLTQPTTIWYGILFISSIWVTSNPGETAWVVAMGVGNYSFPAQDPVQMYERAVNWEFEADIRHPGFTPGYWTTVYIPITKGEFVWMKINKPGVGTYYIALYPLTSADSYILISNSGWAHNKLIGIVFAKNATSAKGTLLAVYGSSLSDVYQNINNALNILGATTQYVTTPQHITTTQYITLIQNITLIHQITTTQYIKPTQYITTTNYVISTEHIALIPTILLVILAIMLVIMVMIVVIMIKALKRV